jgi:hypothetical protein
MYFISQAESWAHDYITYKGRNSSGLELHSTSVGTGNHFRFYSASRTFAFPFIIQPAIYCPSNALRGLQV